LPEVEEVEVGLGVDQDRTRARPHDRQPHMLCWSWAIYQQEKNDLGVRSRGS
jgi:hypothetical protein